MPLRCSESKPPARSRAPAAAAASDEVERGAIKKSRAGRWRALALLLVHVLIALHVAHWWRAKETLSPLEPSEAMLFSKTSIVNAGAVLFALAIVSTLFLGRFFCGWACHVLALQDGCRWMLLKLGIRPRAANLGPLGLVPFLAFVYMFVAPLVQRLLAGDDLGVRGTHYMTSAFWATFPTWPVAVATFLVCGFAIVYFLGSKGFCTYGCPYGGIFGVVDQLAPVRIRVTDACEGCGHCTAVCSSNVKVHQEVRDWGMVVDAGCMKCLDCVSVCPNDALYVGFGVPAIAARLRAPKAESVATKSIGVTQPRAKRVATSASDPQASRGASLASTRALARTLLSFAFIAASLAVFMSYDGAPDIELLAWIFAGSFAVAWLFRGKARRAQDYSLGEEVLLAALFLAAMLAFRGLFDAVPFLFALGLSASLAYLAVQLGRLAYRPNVSIQNLTLRLKGRVTRRGAVFASLMLPIVAGWGYSGWHRYRAGQRAELAREVYQRGVERFSAGDVDAGIAELARAVELDPAWHDARRSLGSMLCDAGRFAEGIAEFERILDAHPDDTAAHILAGLAHEANGDLARAQEHLEAAVRIDPSRADAHLSLGRVCAARGDTAAAERHRARAQELAERAQR